MCHGVLPARVGFGFLLALAATAALGISAGCDEDALPKEPLSIRAFLSIQPDGDALLVVSCASSVQPITLVNDGKVEINGYNVPRYEDGYMYVGPLPLEAGDTVRLTVQRGYSFSATVELPGKATVVEPVGGSAHDADQPINVSWTAPDVPAASYIVWVSDEFTESILGWNEGLDGQATGVTIPAGELKPGQNNVVVHVQAMDETSEFSGGELLEGSALIVSNDSESGPFSTL